MSKYLCRKCGQNAGHVDFLNNDQDQIVSAVYAYCLPCKIDAWGGMKFHPEMNDHFNQLFAPNFNPIPSEQERRYTLVLSNDLGT